jgi:ATP phosphoribosyltransferase regulatory subunit
LPFEASFGRTTMEYYDGFVFGFLAPVAPRPAARGHRRALRRPDRDPRAEAIPAVGGVIRPELVRDLRAGGTP